MGASGMVHDGTCCTAFRTHGGSAISCGKVNTPLKLPYLADNRLVKRGLRQSGERYGFVPAPSAIVASYMLLTRLPKS